MRRRKCKERKRQGLKRAEGNYGFTATQERTVNNVKVLIRESQWYLLDFYIVPIDAKYYSDYVVIIPIIGYIIN